MKKSFILFFTFLFAALSALEVFPVGKKYFYKTGEDIVFQINLDKGRANVRFPIRIAGYEELNRTFTVSADAEGSYELRFQAEKPGFVFVEVKDNNKTAVVCQLTQEETLAMREGKATVQMRFIDSNNNAYATDKVELDVKDVIYKEVIVYDGGGT